MNSQRTILAVIAFLGLVGLATVIGGFVLAYNGTDIPAELIALGSGATGAIGGILAKTGTEPIPLAVGPEEPPAELTEAATIEPTPAAVDFGDIDTKLRAAASTLLEAAEAIKPEDPPQ